MEIITNFKIKIANLENIYRAIKSTGRRYTISLLVRYNTNLRLRSFCYAVGGCQTHFHWGPYQHYVCPQRASFNC